MFARAGRITYWLVFTVLALLTVGACTLGALMIPLSIRDEQRRHRPHEVSTPHLHPTPLATAPGIESSHAISRARRATSDPAA
jgi:hypothetical protein